MNVTPLWELAGWTMIHFLWIGAVIATMTALLRVPLQRAAPSIRYGVTLVCFITLTAAPLAIAGWLGMSGDFQTHSSRSLSVSRSHSANREIISPDEPPGESPTEQPVEQPAKQFVETQDLDTRIDLAKTPLVVGSESAESGVTNLEAETPRDNSLGESEPGESPTPVERLASRIASEAAPEVSPAELVLDESVVASWLLLDQISRWLPWVWIVGTPLTFLLLGSGLVGVKRMRRDAETLVSGPTYEACQRLRISLRIGRQVAVAVSEKIVQPMLIGIVRPLILLPSAAIRGWTPEQLEMALAHELAHVRRWDNLVNLFQRIAESLLFFHPAVWLVSRWLRTDREPCCDAVVVGETESPEAYADLLIAVAAQASGHALPLTASPMAAHSLTRRVRRILQLEDDPMFVSRSTLGFVGLVSVAIICLIFWQPGAKSVAQDAAGEGTEPQGNESKEATTGVPFDEGSPKKAGSQEAPAKPFLFLPLEQQRITDLAYGMLYVETNRLDKKLLPVVKEHGFQGGIQVEKISGRNSLTRAGDILVGLHVWPTGDFDQLAEVLRRDDLMEFSPLKFYVLRSSPRRRPSSAIQGGGRSRAIGMESVGSDSVGGALEWRLVTGRISIPGSAWEKEQSRLARARGWPGAGKRAAINPRMINGLKAIGPNFRQIRPGVGIPVEVAPKRKGETPIHRVDLPTALVEVAPKRKGETPAARVAPTEKGTSRKVPLEQLLYDGRTFDMWRTQWKTELKVEQRTEAIQALAAFGRAGYGQKAVESLLDVAGEYDFRRLDNNEPEGKLKNAVLKELAKSSGGAFSSTVWLPELAKRYQSSPDRYHWLVVHLLGRITEIDKAGREQLLAWSTSDDPHMRIAVLPGLLQTDRQRAEASTDEAFRRNLTDPDASVRLSALSHVTRNLFFLPDPQHLEEFKRYHPELLANLFYEDPQVRSAARWALARNRERRDHKKTLQPISGKLFEVLADPAKAAPYLGKKPNSDLSEEEKLDAQLAAIRALAAGKLFGSKDRMMLIKLMKSHPQKLGVTVGVVINLLDGNPADHEWGRTFLAQLLLQAKGGPSAKIGMEEQEERTASLTEAFAKEGRLLIGNGRNELGGGGFDGGGGQF